MDPPIHPVPRKAASRFDGKGGDRRVPHAPRDGKAGERLHAEPSLERDPVPLPPRFGNEDSLDRGDRKTSTSAAASRRADAGGGPSPSLQDDRHHPAHGRASLWIGASSHRMLPSPGEGHRLRTPRDPGPRRQRAEGANHPPPRPTPEADDAAPRDGAPAGRARRPGRSRLRGAPLCPRPKVPLRSARLGLAMGLPGNENLHGARERRTSPPSPPRDRATTSRPNRPPRAS